MSSDGEVGLQHVQHDDELAEEQHPAALGLQAGQQSVQLGQLARLQNQLVRQLVPLQTLGEGAGKVSRCGGRMRTWRYQWDGQDKMAC